VALNLVSSNILDGNGVKAMPGLISAPNSGRYRKIRRKVQVAKWGTPKKNIVHI